MHRTLWVGKAWILEPSTSHSRNVPGAVSVYTLPRYTPTKPSNLPKPWNLKSWLILELRKKPLVCSWIPSPEGGLNNLSRGSSSSLLFVLLSGCFEVVIRCYTRIWMVRTELPGVTIAEVIWLYHSHVFALVNHIRRGQIDFTSHKKRTDEPNLNHEDKSKLTSAWTIHPKLFCGRIPTNSVTGRRLSALKDA